MLTNIKANSNVEIYKFLNLHFSKEYQRYMTRKYLTFTKETPKKGYSHGAVASDDLRCSRVGVDLMKRKNANAFDVAVAIELCLDVINMHSTGIGGGGFAILYNKKYNKFIGYNFREKTSSMIYKSIVSPSKKKMSKGKFSFGVPGVVHGLYTIWKNYGSIPWDELVAPSVFIAYKGFKMHVRLRQCSLKAMKKIKSNKNLRALLFKNNQLKNVGDVIKNRMLAKTLYIIANDPISLYRKSLLQKTFLEDLKKMNIRHFTYRDLNNYATKSIDLIKINLNNIKVVTLGGRTGGPILAFILKHMYNFIKFKPILDKFEYYHYLLETTKHAYGNRFQLLSKNKYKLLNKYYWRTRLLKDIKNKTQDRSHYIKNQNTNLEIKGTSHFSVIDNIGNAVAMTTSLNSMFGSGIVSKKTGIILNNNLADYDKGKNKYIWPKAPYNKKNQSKRPASYIAPTLIYDKKIIGVFGASGGAYIPVSLSQVLLNKYFKNMTLSMSVKEFRLYHILSPNRIRTNKNNKIPSNLKKYLKEKGHIFKKIDHCTEGIVNGIFIKRKIHPFSDRRKSNGELGY